MTLTAFFLVFVSVFMHAGWNVLSKKTAPSLAFFAIANSTAALLCLPGLLASGVAWGALPADFWGWLLLSVVFEVIYVVGLTGAYRRGDISLVYPMARALPVLMTAGMTMLFGWGARPGPVALLGMAILSAGCLLMPFARWSDVGIRGYRGAVLGFILLAAVGTTGYTLIDSHAITLFAQQGGGDTLGAIAYLALLETGLALSLIALTLARPTERETFHRIWRRTNAPHWSGLFSAAAYVFILLAMGYVTNVSYVQAFRQMSLPIGVLAGVVMLGEKPGAPRWAGLALVVAGLVLSGLGG